MTSTRRPRGVGRRPGLTRRGCGDGHDQELAMVGAPGPLSRAGAGVYRLRRALADGAGLAPGRRVALDPLGDRVFGARGALDADEPDDAAAARLGCASDLRTEGPEGLDD